jgi:hypothetical protein
MPDVVAGYAVLEVQSPVYGHWLMLSFITAVMAGPTEEEMRCSRHVLASCSVGTIGLA